MRRYTRSILLTLALVALLSACGGGGSSEAFPTPGVRPYTSIVTGNTPGPVRGAVVRFPADEAPHPDITEWWYYTGHVTTSDGQRYGIEYVIFQGGRADFPIGYAAHFAVIDPQKPAFTFDEDAMISRDARFGGADGFRLRVNDWTMRGLNGVDQLHARMKSGAYAINISATDEKGPVLQGGGQFSYGPGGSSYYYSRTRLRPSGSIIVGDTTKQITGGTLWFDHQWGNFLPSNGGWDWFSTQLDDQSEMMIYNLRDASGKLIQTFGEYVPPCTRDCSPARNQFPQSNSHRTSSPSRPSAHGRVRPRASSTRAPGMWRLPRRATSRRWTSPTPRLSRMRNWTRANRRASSIGKATQRSPARKAPAPSPARDTSN